MNRCLGLEKDKFYFKASIFKAQNEAYKWEKKKWFYSPDASWL